MSKIKMGVECGQRWYRFSSWFPYTKTKRGWRRRFAGTRWLGHREVRYGPIVKRDGFAIGPLMFWKD